MADKENIIVRASLSRGLPLLFFILAFVQMSFSQNETNYWYFGFGAGLNFNNIPPTALTDGQLNTFEGTATISDSSGNLLFYTDGDTVWNKNHQVMQNGTGLQGDESSTQSALIIPKPGSSVVYYIFTTSYFNSFFGYSIVDMSLNGGAGEIIKKNIPLRTELTTEKLTAVKHCNGKDIWVIALDALKDNPTDGQKFYAYLITTNGISSPITSEYPLSFLSIGLINQLKASSNGKYLAWDGQHYANFDNSTGKVNNFKTSQPYPSNFYYDVSYGVEFSPNSKYLYNSAFQIDLSTGSLFSLDSHPLGFGLQLASDGKIYVGMSIIENPNLYGAACSLNKNTLSLAGKTYAFSFPNFMSSYFYHPKGEFSYIGECAGSSFNFYLKNTASIDSVLWKFHDGTVSKNWAPTYIYSTPGSYSVDVITYQAGIAETTSQCISVNGVFPNFLGSDLLICTGSDAKLMVQYPVMGKYLWSTGDTTTEIKVTQSGRYWVKVANGCAISSDTIVVTEKSCNKNSPIFGPNVFTPNGDGYNDVFKLELLAGGYAENVECNIYNRWGEKMSCFQGINGSWDGKTKEGILASDGAYYYVAAYINKKGQKEFLSGYIQLISN